MPDQRTIAVTEIDRDPLQPRQEFDVASLVELGNNMKTLGQLVPVICYLVPELNRYCLADGERRFRAAQSVALKELDAIVLPERPTPAELHIIQISLDAHRSNLSAMERSDFLARIKQENNWSIGELAEKLNMKQPFVTKLLKFQEVCPEVRAALETNRLDCDKAYTISQEPDHDKQRELLRQAGNLNREQLR